MKVEGKCGFREYFFGLYSISYTVISFFANRKRGKAATEDVNPKNSDRNIDRILFFLINLKISFRTRLIGRMRERMQFLLKIVVRLCD